MRTVKVHYCFDQHLGKKLPAKCGCKKEIAYQEAEQLVSKGAADWVVLSRTPISLEEAKVRKSDRGRLNPSLEELNKQDELRKCPICPRRTPALRKHCPNCHGRGYVEPEIIWEELSRWTLPEPGGQIVMSAQSDERKRTNRSKRQKTPRVATVEGPSPKAGGQRLGHIMRAYVLGKKYDQDRIEEYGRVNRLELRGKPQNAALKDKTFEVIFEPDDVPSDMTHDAQGRRYDFGQAVWS